MIQDAFAFFQEQYFWFGDGPFAGRYLFLYERETLELEFTPAREVRSARLPDLATGPSGAYLAERIQDRLEELGGMRVSLSQLGPYAVYFNIISFQGFPLTNETGIKVVQAIGPDHVQTVFATVVQAVRKVCCDTEIKLEDRSKFLDKLGHFESLFNDKVVHWLDYSLMSESLALTLRPPTGTMYAVDEVLVGRPVTQEEFDPGTESYQRAIRIIESSGLEFSIREMINALSRQRHEAFVGSVSRRQSRQVIRALKKVLEDDEFCASVDSMLKAANIAITTSPNYLKILHSPK